MSRRNRVYEKAREMKYANNSDGPDISALLAQANRENSSREDHRQEIDEFSEEMDFYEQ